jgi:hypothetical protein
MALKQDEYKIIVSAIDKTGMTFEALQRKLAALKKETPVTETYELSKAFRQVGTSLSGLSFVPVIGEMTNIGAMVTSTAGSLKNLMAALKNLGGVSVTALGPLGLAGAAGLAAGGGFALGKAIDSWVYKLTNIDISGLNKTKEIMERIKEEATAMTSRIEKATTELAKLGITPGATWAQTMERFNEEVKKGTVLYDQASHKWISQADAAAKVLEELKKKFISTMEAQKETLTGQLNNVKTYYNSLVKLHADYIEKAKKKTEELLTLEGSIKGSRTTTEDIILSVRQKGMTPSEQYSSAAQKLEDQYWIAQQMSGEEKIKMLQSIQQEWANLSNEVRDGETVAISASDAVRKAISEIERMGMWIGDEQRKMKASMQDEIASIGTTAEGLSQAMQTAQVSITDITNQIAQMDMALAKEKKIDINVNQAFDNIKKVREMIDSIPDVTVKKIIIETYGKGSSILPISEKIEEIKGKIDELDISKSLTLDLSGFSNLISQWQIISGIASSERHTFITGSKAGKLYPWAGEIENMIGSLATRLSGYYMSLIPNFQGLTSPIEFQKPSLIQVHTGEKLYPAGKTENITFSPTIYVSGAKDPEASAKEIDSKLADMWRTGRSRLKRAMQ